MSSALPQAAPEMPGGCAIQLGGVLIALLLLTWEHGGSARRHLCYFDHCSIHVLLLHSKRWCSIESGVPQGLVRWIADLGQISADWHNAGAWAVFSSPCLQAACSQAVQACSSGNCCTIQPCQAQSKSHRGKQNPIHASSALSIISALQLNLCIAA